MMSERKFIAVLAVLVLVSWVGNADADVSDYAMGYENPCDDALIADMTAMLNADGSECADDGPSYKCSGLFAHGFDCVLGQEVEGNSQTLCKLGGYLNNDIPGVEPFVDATLKMMPPYDPSPFFSPPPLGDQYNLTNVVPSYEIFKPVGEDGSLQTYDGDACPDVTAQRPIPVDAYPTTIPPQCPTSLAMQFGGISFAYLRKDILPTKEQEMATKGHGSDGITTFWAGPGMIVRYKDNMTFWDDPFRLMALFPSDAFTLLRNACGAGRGIVELEVTGEDKMLEDKTQNTVDAIGHDVPWCPNDPTSVDDIEAIMPEGYNAYCPDWVTDIETYKLWTGFSKQQLMSIGLTERDAEEFSYCALSSERFDSIFIPSATQGKIYDGVSGVSPFWYYSNAKWNEALIKEWGGIAFDDLAEATVMYYFDGQDNDTMALTYEYARWLSEASGVPVPVVKVTTSALFEDPLAPFSCAVLEDDMISDS